MKKPQFVIAVRHGEYDRNQNLTPQGVEDIEKLASLIGRIAQGKTVALFTSPQKRAVNSANIISDHIHVDPITLRSLSNDGYFDGCRAGKEIIEKLGDQPIEVVITVGHHEAPSGVVNCFSDKFFGVEEESSEKEGYPIEDGTAIIFNLEKNTTESSLSFSSQV